MSELQSRLVPLLVEKEDFWARYFYRSAGGGVKPRGRACVGMGARGCGGGWEVHSCRYNHGSQTLTQARMGLWVSRHAFGAGWSHCGKGGLLG